MGKPEQVEGWFTLGLGLVVEDNLMNFHTCLTHMHVLTYPIVSKICLLSVPNNILCVYWLTYLAIHVIFMWTCTCLYPVSIPYLVLLLYELSRHTSGLCDLIDLNKNLISSSNLLELWLRGEGGFMWYLKNPIYGALLWVAYACIPIVCVCTYYVFQKLFFFPLLC